MAEAFFRFYEELNDFLPAEKQKNRFAHCFKERASVKDMIEALGIPHTEVDLILVNGESEDFNYVVQDKDRISVYPVFESLDIRQVSKVRPVPLRDIKFILDIHLGKLARLLRMFGFDTLHQKEYSPERILSVSLLEKRIIISKSRRLMKRRAVTHGYCLNSSDPEMEARLVLKRFDLFKNIHPFTRCLECNSLLEGMKRDAAAALVPPAVLEEHEEFKWCRKCEKVYWNGSHYQKMRERIQKLTIDN